MFVVLFLVTFVLAFAISSGVAWAGKEPIEAYCIISSPSMSPPRCRNISAWRLCW
jgi:hypothetical protein